MINELVLPIGVRAKNIYTKKQDLFISKNTLFISKNLQLKKIKNMLSQNSLI